jgi:hypothetical protein
MPILKTSRAGLLLHDERKKIAMSDNAHKRVSRGQRFIIKPQKLNQVRASIRNVSGAAIITLRFNPGNVGIHIARVA